GEGRVTTTVSGRPVAVYALELVGLAGLSWLALAPGPLPLAAAPPGTGLLVGVESATPEEVAELLDEFPSPRELEALELPALALLPEGSADRLKLARAGLDTRAELPEAPSVAALAWLARRPQGVARAVPLLRTDDELTDWLGQVRLKDGKELALLKGRLRPQHHDLVRRGLAGPADHRNTVGLSPRRFPAATPPRPDLPARAPA